MNITVSGTEKEYPDGTTVEQMFRSENAGTQFITVNDEFIKASDRPIRKLNDGDVVEFLYYMGGGR